MMSLHQIMILNTIQKLYLAYYFTSKKINKIRSKKERSWDSWQVQNSCLNVVAHKKPVFAQCFQIKTFISFLDCFSMLGSSRLSRKATNNETGLKAARWNKERQCLSELYKCIFIHKITSSVSLAISAAIFIIFMHINLCSWKENFSKKLSIWGEKNQQEEKQTFKIQKHENEFRNTYSNNFAHCRKSLT